MPDIPKGYLRIAGYPVDSGNWTSRVDVWGNEAVLKSSSSIPVTLNQVVTVDYVSGGNITTLVSNGIVNRIEAREEGFEKTYEYTVWGKEYVGKYRLSSETGTIQPATLKLQNYMTAIGLTPTFYNLSGVTLAPNEMANQYISDIVDEICKPATIHYYFKTDGSPVFFVGTISTVSISTQLTEKERNEDLSKVYNQILIDTNYHPVNENFDLFTDTVSGNFRWKIPTMWTSWYSLSSDTITKLIGSISLKASSIEARVTHNPTLRRAGVLGFDSCDLGAFVRIPTSSTLTASSFTGFFVAIGSSLNPGSSQGISSVDLRVRILLGPDSLETPDEDKRYLATEVHITANTFLTWNSISLDKEAFITKNKIKTEEMSSTTLSYLHFQIESSTIWTAVLNHTTEKFTFWFDQGYLTEYASTLIVDLDSQSKYGIRELAPEELGSEPASAKSYNDLVAKGRSLLTPKPEQFYSRVEVPATLSLLTLGNAYTLSYGSTLITGMVTEIQLDVPEDEMPSWIYTFSSSPEYPSRTKLYKKLERLDTEVRYLLNTSPSARMPSEARIIPYIVAGVVSTDSSYINAGYIYTFQANQIEQIGTIGTIGNIGSFNADYIGNISQIGTIGNISTMNVYSIGSIGLINTIGQANFGYVGNIGSIGYIGSIDRMSVNRIDNINSISNITYAAIVEANVQNIGNVQNMTAAYINVTNMATLVSATITNAYVTNISNINTLNASNLYVSNIGSINTAYITNANITNISSLSSASIGTAYISVIQNVATLVATTANITHIGNVSDLTATQANITNISGVTNLTATTANVTNIIASSATITSSTIGNVIATNAQLSGSIKTDKIVALTTQITIGSSGQQVYIPVPSTIINLYGTSIHMSWGTVDTVLIGTISANSINFNIGTVQTFYIGSASASVMNFNIGTISNVNITGVASGNQMSFSSATIGNINISSIGVIQTLSVTSGTLGQLNVTGIGHISIFDLDAGTIDSALITVGTLSNATITFEKVGSSYISISTIDSCTITFGTISSLFAVSENVSTLSITSYGSIAFATISAAGIGGLCVSSGTLVSCTITSGQIGALSITSSTINQLEITTPLIGQGVIRADNMIFLPYNWIPNPSFEVVDSSGILVDWRGVTRVSGGKNSNYSGAVASGSFAWANATIRTEGNEIWRYKGYSKSQTTHYFVLKILDSDYNPISTLFYPLSSSTDFAERTWQAYISTGAYWMVPGLYSLGTFDLLSLSKDVGAINIGDGQITAQKIAADAVTTSAIHFDPLGSDPSDKVLTLWYNTIADQLRFGDAFGNVGYIKRYPITEYSSPPENLLPNQCFETDLDGDGIPDFWSFGWESGGSGNRGLTTGAFKGANCFYITNTASAGSGVLRSSYIPVVGSRKYLLSGAVKLSSGSYSKSWLFVEWFDSSKAYISSSVITATVGTSWSILSGVFEAPSSARYAKVGCHSRDYYNSVYFDELTFSEMRAYFNPQKNYIFPPFAEADRSYEGIAQYYAHATYIKVERTVRVSGIREDQYSTGGVTGQYIGIYADDGTGYPGKRLWSYGPFTWNGGWQEFTIDPPLTLEPGIYWLVHYNSNAVTNNIMRAVKFLPLFSTSTAQLVGGWSVYTTSGLTDPFPSGGAVRQSVHEIGLVIAS